MNKLPDDLIPIGKIIKPYGIKGQIKFKFYNEKSSILKEGTHIWLNKENEKDFQFFEIDSINYKSNNPIIKFDGFNDRNKAVEFRNYIAYISRSLLSNKKNEIYFVDFIGCEIYDHDELSIGIAKDILHFKGDNHVMVVENKGKEFLIPLRNDLIKFFDVNKKRVIIKIIDGLVNN